MMEHRTSWGRNLEFWLKFLGSSQKLLPYTVKDIPSVYQWKQWLKIWQFCWRNLHTREVFTKMRTFTRKHQWQYQERRFRKIKNSFWQQDGQIADNVWKESLIIMNHSCNCGKNVWKKSWTKKQRQGLWFARAKWNLFILFFSGSGCHARFTQRLIICQSRFNLRWCQPSRERNLLI